MAVWMLTLKQKWKLCCKWSHTQIWSHCFLPVIDHKKIYFQLFRYDTQCLKKKNHTQMISELTEKHSKVLLKMFAFLKMKCVAVVNDKLQNNQKSNFSWPCWSLNITFTIQTNWNNWQPLFFPLFFHSEWLWGRKMLVEWFFPRRESRQTFGQIVSKREPLLKINPERPSRTVGKTLVQSSGVLQRGANAGDSCSERFTPWGRRGDLE